MYVFVRRVICLFVLAFLLLGFGLSGNVRGHGWMEMGSAYDILTKLSKVGGVRHIHMYVQACMTLYNTRFGNAKQDIVSICTKDRRTYIHVSP